MERARAAFDDLSTADKTAFVLEATFQTLGQAIGETGRHVSDALTDLSDLDVEAWFRPSPSRPAPPATGTPPGADAPGPAMPPVP